MAVVSLAVFVRSHMVLPLALHTAKFSAQNLGRRIDILSSPVLKNYPIWVQHGQLESSESSALRRASGFESPEAAQSERSS